MPGRGGDGTVSGWSWISKTNLGIGGSFTFARGASPDRVMEAFGMNPANAFVVSAAQAVRSLPYPDDGETHPPEHPWIRVGTTGEWAFALDESSGGSGGYEEDAARALSAGSEAALLTHVGPLNTFHFYADGAEVTAFEPMRAWDRWGTDPDRFLPYMQAAGLSPDDDTAPRGAVIAVAEMLTLALGIRLDEGTALGPLRTVQRD